nr:unnamed protein product [Callosobruchus analis]
MGQEFLEDDERPGRPVEVITEDKVVLVEELVLSDLHLKVKEIAEVTKLSDTPVRQSSTIIWITAQSGVKCVKCDTVTHRGCLKYLKNVTIIDSDLIVCCEDVPLVAIVILHFDAIDHQADDNKVDVRIFHYIVKQKDMLIKELYDKIDLLNERLNSCMRKVTHLLL